jgi:hypothetical protein
MLHYPKRVHSLGHAAPPPRRRAIKTCPRTTRPNDPRGLRPAGHPASRIDIGGMTKRTSGAVARDHRQSGRQIGFRPQPTIPQAPVPVPTSASPHD